MSQQLATDDRRTPSGTICKESNLYKCSNGNFEILQFVEAGEAFPTTPFGDTKAPASWQKVTVASDGGRDTFDGRQTAIE
jgi:hypothetical protein